MHESSSLTMLSYLSIATLIVVYFFLITEKINKIIVAVMGGMFVILAQFFQNMNEGGNSIAGTSQEIGFHFISKNLDILGFIIGMMILVGIVKESGVFEAVAIWLVKLVKGDPVWLLISISYLTLIMTAMLSNIPTVLIVAPVMLVLVKQLKLPFFPFLFAVVGFANIGGATTSISDPTTYYEAKTVGLSFMEVVLNSGVGVLLTSVSSIIYLLVVFWKDLKAVKVNPSDIASFNPSAAIKNKEIMYIGIPTLFISIGLMVFKEGIAGFGIKLDNASIVLFASFFLMLIFKKSPQEVFEKIVDWETIFFFMGLFVLIGSLEHNGVIKYLALYLVEISNGNVPILLFLTTIGSTVISVFVDNVPYNITMVSAIQEMAKTGIVVYPLWWALNLGTSIGGAGSPIGAACNVVTCGLAEKDGKHVLFMKYLLYGFPLVVINGLVAWGYLYIKYFVLAVK